MPKGKAMVKKLFSDGSVEESRLEPAAAHDSCPKDEGAEDGGFFMVGAGNPAAATEFFGRMAVDARPVAPFGEAANTVEIGFSLQCGPCFLLNGD
jgi:hypothetical protein